MNKTWIPINLYLLFVVHLWTWGQWWDIMVAYVSMGVWNTGSCLILLENIILLQEQMCFLIYQTIGLNIEHTYDHQIDVYCIPLVFLLGIGSGKLNELKLYWPEIK